MTKKIISALLCILIIFSFSQVYAASEPSANASKSKIQKYVRKNDISKVSLEKLVAWYKKTGSDTAVVAKIDSAIRKKKAKEINEYIKTFDDARTLNKQIPETLLNFFQTKLNPNPNAAGSSDYKESYNKVKSAVNMGNPVEDPTDSPEYYDPTSGVKASTETLKKAGIILGAIRNIGVVISVIILMVLGIKYMLGSLEEKAEYKKSMIPYLIGVALIFSGSVIPSVIYNFMN